jgi:ribosomal protein L34
LRRNCLLKQIIKEKREKGRIDEEEDISRYWITLMKQTILESERVRTRSHGLENSFGRGCGPVVRQAA